jgi:S-adenosylmethionine-diacylglycerol 3-amino-3-carboxypropyl transferase
MSRALIETAARSHPMTSRRGLMESLFSQLFTGFVYPQIWEDPEVDVAALELSPGARIATIASGGCNVMSYLVAEPARIIAVDLNPAHLALLKLKLAAARTLEDHADFFQLFGEARGEANVRLFDDRIAAALDEETRRYWQRRNIKGQRRIRLFADGLYRRGVLGRTIGLAHLACRLHGAEPSALLEARTPEEQLAMFESVLGPVFEKPLVRALAKLPTSLYGLGIPPEQYAALTAENPGDPAAVLRDRVRRLLCDFPLADNYFAWQALARAYGPTGTALPPYLQAANFPLIRQLVGRVDVRHETMTETLKREATATLDGFVLLDAQDWMTPAQLEALWREIDRTAAVTARVICRTAGAASPVDRHLPVPLRQGWRRLDALSAELFARDRSAVYGGFHVYARADGGMVH